MEASRVIHYKGITCIFLFTARVLCSSSGLCGVPQHLDEINSQPPFLNLMFTGFSPPYTHKKSYWLIMYIYHVLKAFLIPLVLHFLMVSINLYTLNSLQILYRTTWTKSNYWIKYGIPRSNVLNGFHSLKRIVELWYIFPYFTHNHNTILSFIRLGLFCIISDLNQTILAESHICHNCYYS